MRQNSTKHKRAVASEPVQTRSRASGPPRCAQNQIWTPPRREKANTHRKLFFCSVHAAVSVRARNAATGSSSFSESIKKTINTRKAALFTNSMQVQVRSLQGNTSRGEHVLTRRYHDDSHQHAKGEGQHQTRNQETTLGIKALGRCRRLQKERRSTGHKTSRHSGVLVRCSLGKHGNIKFTFCQQPGIGSPSGPCGATRRTRNTMTTETA